MQTSVRPTPVNILGEIREYLRQKIVESEGNSNENVGIASNIRRLSLVLRQQNFRNDYQSTRCRTKQDHSWIEVVERDVEWPFLWTHV